MAKLVPEIEARLGPLTPNPSLPPNEERLRLFDNLTRFFQALAAPHGLLLFLDDLHWADQGTLALLHYLLRRLRRDARILILATYREVELDRAHLLSAALVDWNRERLATRIALGRLSIEETGAMLAALFGETSVSLEFREAIHRETEGNPFFIEEVVKSLIEQGEIYRVEAGWDRKAITQLTIPQSIKEAIGRRLNRLSARCIDILHTASALSEVFPFDELAAVAAVSEDQLLDALDEASAAQLIRADGGEAFAFTHDKIREVLYEELNPIRRRRLHQRIGEELEKLYATPAVHEAHVPDLAHHFIQSADLQKGLAYSLGAAAQVRRLFALEEALGYYQRAAECAEVLGLPDQLASIHQHIGDVHSQRGVFQSAVEHYRRALTFISPGDCGRRAVLNQKIGGAYIEVGDQRGLNFLHLAERELDPATQTDELAHTLALLGRYHHYRSQHRKAIEFYERARQLAEPLDRADTLHYIYNCLAGAYQHLAQFGESQAWARRSIALDERKNYSTGYGYLADDAACQGDWSAALEYAASARAISEKIGALDQLACGYEYLADDAACQGDWSAALEYAASARAISEKIGALDQLAWAGFCCAQALYGRGELQPAFETARAALTLAQQIGDEWHAIWLGPLLAMIETDLGLDEAARADAELWLEHAEQLGIMVTQCWPRQGLAYYHLQRAEWAQATELYGQCAAFYGSTDNRLTPLQLGPYPALARLGLGHVGEAAQMITNYLALACEAEAPHYVGCALHVQGQIFAAQRLTAEARTAFDESIATLEKLGSRLELGRALYQRGLFRQTLGEADAAQDDWRRALTIFEACGAARDRERAAELLR